MEFLVIVALVIFSIGNYRHSARLSRRIAYIENSLHQIATEHAREALKEWQAENAHRAATKTKE